MVEGASHGPPGHGPAAPPQLLVFQGAEAPGHASGHPAIQIPPGEQPAQVVDADAREPRGPVGFAALLPVARGIPLHQQRVDDGPDDVERLGELALQRAQFVEQLLGRLDVVGRDDFADQVARYGVGLG